VLDRAGGDVLSYFIPSAIGLTVVEGGRNSKTIVCNAIVTPHGEEVLLSDAVI